MVLSLLPATSSVFPVMLLYALMGWREKKKKEKNPKAGSGEVGDGDCLDVVAAYDQDKIRKCPMVE